MMATDEELAAAIEAGTIPRITVRPEGVRPPPEAPFGQLVDPSFANRYMTTVQEPGQPDREQFTLPVARRARDAYATRYSLGGLVSGDYRMPEPTRPWDPDRPGPGLEPMSPIRSVGERVQAAAEAPARFVAGTVKALTDIPMPPHRPVTAGLGPTEQSAAEDIEFARAQQKQAANTALNMIGAGRLPGAAPPGAFGAGGGQALRGWHGSPRQDITQFTTRTKTGDVKPAFFAVDEGTPRAQQFAAGFKGQDGRLYDVNINSAGIVDTRTPEGLKAFKDALDNYYPFGAEAYMAEKGIKEGALPSWGDDLIFRALDKAGHKGVLLNERPGLVSAAVFDSGGITIKPSGSTTLGAGAEAPRAPLPMDEASRAARAREQGYTIDAYHGTSAPEFNQFDPSKVRDNIQYGGNFYFSPNPEFASKASTSWGGEHPRVMPVKLKAENPFRMDQPVTNEQAAKVLQALGGREEQVKAILEGGPLKHWTGSTLFYHAMGQNVSAAEKANAIRKAGYDAIIGDPGREIAGKPGREHIMVFEPDQIRSRYAAFDPANKESGFLLGAGANDPRSVGLATLRGAAADQAWRTGTAEERLRTSVHPYGGNIPLRDMPQPIIQGAPNWTYRQVDPEKELKNAGLIFASGDPTGAGGRLYGFEGMPRFENPVPQMGGVDYARRVGALVDPAMPSTRRLWASDRPAMSGILNVAKDVERQGRDPWLVYMTGAKPYMDQATQVVNTAVEAAHAKGVSQAMNQHIVDKMRSDWNVPASGVPFPETGLNDRAALKAWLDDQPMPQHSKLVKAMGSAEAQKLGFPDIGMIRYGNTDPRLLTAQPGSAGLMLGRVDTQRGLITPSMHPDYNTAIAGDQLRTFGRNLPVDVIAPTMHQQRVEQIRPLRPGQPSAYLNAPHLYYGNRGTSQKFEPVTNQWLDTVQNWQQNNPEQRIGGVVLGAGANDPKSVGLGTVLNATRNQEPIRAYHASPHDFDKFDISKIGTGEGAQTYGHGLYFAENPKVSGQGGQYWQQFKNRFAYNPAEMEAVSVLENHNFDRAKAIIELEDLKKYDAGYIGGATNAFDRQKREAIVAKNHEALEILKSGRPVGPRTYEVNINARPDLFLDWDKPLSQQSKAVQDVSAAHNLQYGVPDPLAQGVYERLGMKLRDRAAASNVLNEAGVPGIRYLDQGSRPAANLHAQLLKDLEVYERAGNKTAVESIKQQLANPSQGTSNYVVFDPGIVDIMKKYGVVGVPAAGALGSVVNPQEYRQ